MFLGKLGIVNLNLLSTNRTNECCTTRSEFLAIRNPRNIEDPNKQDPNLQHPFYLRLRLQWLYHNLADHIASQLPMR